MIASFLLCTQPVAITEENLKRRPTRTGLKIPCENEQKSRIQGKDPAYQKLAQLGDIPGSIAGLSVGKQGILSFQKHPCYSPRQLGVGSFQDPQVRRSDIHQPRGFPTADDSSDQNPGL